MVWVELAQGGNQKVTFIVDCVATHKFISAKLIDKLILSIEWWSIQEKW